MRHLVCYSVIVLASVSMSAAFAGGFDYAKEDSLPYATQQNFQLAQNNTGPNYSRNGYAVYFFGGYVYTYHFLSNSVHSVYDPINNVTYSYKPSSIFSDSSSNVELGAGMEVSQYINFEAAYLQQFTENKTGSTTNNVATYSNTKMNAILVDMGIVFNPDDQFQVLGKLGAQLSQFKTTLSINNANAFTFNDQTQIEPAAGLEFLFQCSQNFGLRVDTMYVADTENSFGDGAINAMAGFNYTLK